MERWCVERWRKLTFLFLCCDSFPPTSAILTMASLEEGGRERGGGRGGGGEGGTMTRCIGNTF